MDNKKAEQTYGIPELGMPAPPTTFEGRYGFPMSDLNFESPMSFVWTLGVKSKMDNQEKRTLLEVIEMYLEGNNYRTPSAKERELENTILSYHQALNAIAVCEDVKISQRIAKETLKINK